MTSMKNSVLDLTDRPDSIEVLQVLLDATKGKAEGSQKCTITRHRIAKTAVVVGAEVLLRYSASGSRSMVQESTPLLGKSKGQLRRKELVLEHSRAPGILEKVHLVWKHLGGTESHRRVMTAAFCLGVDTLNRVDSGLVRRLVSKVCPVKFKYWDPELGLWL